MNDAKIVLAGRGIKKSFGFGRNKFFAVDDVDFAFHEGEILSIVGASGSGKTTLAKIVLGLLKQSSGEIEYMGAPRVMRTLKDRRAYWSHVQAIFQDPFASFNQFHRVERMLSDCIEMQGLKLSHEESFEKMRSACSFVNLKFEELYNKYPFELSGGQMQRMMIARIFMIGPDILIADEPTSMIDACSRSTILDMLLKLRDENKMTVVFITHDLGLAYYVSDTIMIMSEGRIIESGDAKEVIAAPKSDYTKHLLSDVPKLSEEWKLG
jgi:ABC-type dipeptide/oligopeptide/nickel transport system, ATPase component